MAVSSISNMLNRKIRLTGMSSGLDTDAIIEQLMSVEKAKVDKIKQERQILEWKRDTYRDIISKLRSITDEYFNVLKPKTNFTSTSAFSSFKITSSKESAVTATANAAAASKVHSITVKSLASAGNIVGTSGLVQGIKGSNTVSSTSLQGRELNFTLDGVTKTISLEDYADINDLEQKLETALGKAFGAGKIDVLTTGGKIEFKCLVNGSTLTISEPANNYISSLGFSDGQKNFITGGSDVNSDYSLYTNGSFKITVGSGEAQTINISEATDIDDLTAKIQQAIDNNSELSGKVHVSNDGTKLSFTTLSGETVKLTSGDSNNVLDKLGFSNGATATGISSSVIDLSGNEKGKTFIVNINGVDKTIEIDKNYSDLDELASYIQSQLGGTVKVTKDASSNKLIFSSDGTDKLIFKKGPEDGLEKLGFAANDNKSNRIAFNISIESLNSKLTNNFNITDPNANIVFTINDQVIDVGKSYANATMNDVMNAINSSKAGVKVSYDSLNDRFIMESKTLGATSTIEITDTDPSNGLLKAMGLVGGTYTAGKDAEFTLDGVTDMKRGTNEFTIDGVTYTLKEVTTEPVTIDVKADIDGVVENIKNFINSYNDMISKINSVLTEERDRKYPPLTDDQKKAMTEDDIRRWEEKAKSGLLRSDSILENIVTSLRRALYDKVEGSSLSLYQIGITTGLYQDKGKLVIDEEKLRAALTDNYDGVVQLFTQSSQYTYSQALNDSDKRSVRYKESGIAQRIYDILQDNIRTTRNASGKKGVLLEKAGLVGDMTEYDNLLVNEMKEKDELIDNLLAKIYEKEEYYYKKFAAMEKMLDAMNSQSSWLTQQFSNYRG
ncbi:MAG TPA: flagellar filament capping protein FliD [Acetivibrio sp.]|uniref:flagellar filament capping protein FliD n=1 Tax=Acetivibrio sp. TaxID=1872092 RepID=UPI002B72FC67|nr:flagellar filament capping protein FliD [Acetivibrio sp.]HOM01292.1 flagellar filament capping protein FliD [Acetivibrio sp.]